MYEMSQVDFVMEILSRLVNKQVVRGYMHLCISNFAVCN